VPNVPVLRKRRKAARPSELTAAAMALFAEKGFAATRLEDVAARAGVAKGTLYLYFDSKEALFKAVIEEGILPVLAAGEAVVANHVGSAEALLERLVETWWQGIGATPFTGVPKLMIAESGNFPEVARYYHEQVILPGRALMAAVLRRGMASGEFRALEVESCIDVMIAPLLMLAIWQHSMAMCLERPVEPAAFLATYLDLLKRGLMAQV